MSELYTRRASGICQIRLPMHDHALRYINAYLVEGDDGYALVDCGWGTPDVLAALESALAELGVGLQSIRTVVVTHFHSDHYGLAGTLARLAGTRLFMHHADWAVLDSRFRDIDREMHRRDAWLARNGFATADYAADDRIRRLAGRMSLQRPDRELEDGELVTLGTHAFRVVWTPGHSPGHICLYDEERKTLLSGDHILPQITPHIGYWSDGDPDPLGTFLTSLAKVAELGAKHVLPAHREPIDDLAGRIEELFAHHREREAQILAELDGTPRTGNEVASRLPWRRKISSFEELPATERSFALVETLAHLEHLRARALVERIDAPDLVRYRKLP
ncbi:MAG: MBL fold metallo-hydrolase [Candidatus Eremiobacteraeota bacterium]|nr:MBL fold metallo-hydrolase [Candidatus Eremiobacteraeota bacterium]